MGNNKETMKKMVSGRQVVRNLIILLVLILFFLFFQNIYILPKQAKINDASAKIRALSQEVNTIQLRVDDKRRRAAREAEVLVAYRRMEEQLENAKRMLPTRENISDLLDKLTEPVKRLHVSVLSLQPFPPEETPTLTHLTFKMQLEGRYRNIGRYLHELGTMDRLIMVDNLQLTGVEGDDPRIQAHVLISTYLLKEVQ